MDNLKKFWVFEGLDGAGTTTQIKLLTDKLITMGYNVVSTFEPTDNPIGRLIRKILSGEIPAAQSTITKLFSADRDDHLFNSDYGIIKDLNDGKIVVSDRYILSSLAYQTVNYNYDSVYLENIEFPLPELIIYLDIPLEVSMNRINARGQKAEIYEKRDYLSRVYDNYYECINAYKNKCKIAKINGDQPISKVFDDIMEVVNEVLSEN